MTKDQATAVVAIVRSGGIPQEYPDSILEQWENKLLPLPFDVCRRAAERWVVSVPVDEKGQPVPKFVSEPAAVLTACGVPITARHLVDRALRDGGDVFPSARGAIGDGGWEYVPAGEPLPRGVAEFYENAALPLPPGRQVDPSLPAPPAGVTPIGALVAGQEITEEQRKENLRRLGALARSLGAKKAAS